MAQVRGVYKGPVLDQIQAYKEEMNSLLRIVTGTSSDRLGKLQLLEKFKEGDDLLYLFMVLCTAYDIQDQRSTLRDVVAKEALLQIEQFLMGFIETFLLLFLMKNLLTENYLSAFFDLLFLVAIDQLDKLLHTAVSNIKPNYVSSPTDQFRDNCTLYFSAKKSNPSETMLVVEEKNKNIHRMQTNVTLFSTYLAGKAWQFNTKTIAPRVSDAIQTVATHDFRADGRLFAARFSELRDAASQKIHALQAERTNPVVAEQAESSSVRSMPQERSARNRKK